jgi:hypothetical protein
MGPFTLRSCLQISANETIQLKHHVRVKFEESNAFLRIFYIGHKTNPFILDAHNAQQNFNPIMKRFIFVTEHSRPGCKKPRRRCKLGPISSSNASRIKELEDSVLWSTPGRLNFTPLLFCGNRCEIYLISTPSTMRTQHRRLSGSNPAFPRFPKVSAAPQSY